MPKQSHRNTRGNRARTLDYDRVPEVEEATGETPNIKREFILTPSGDDTLYQIVRILSKGTGTNPTNSHILRVILKAVGHALPEIEKEVSKLEGLKRPSNARGNEAEREEYEHRLASAILLGIQASKPMK